MKTKLPILLSAFTLFVIACMCSSTPSAQPVVVGQNTTSAPASAPTTAPAKTYAVGDVIQVGNSTITLNSATIDSAGVLHTNFTIENKGTENLAVSSIIGFDVKDSEGQKLEQEIMNCESGGLDGTVIPGDKLKGNICWHGVKTDSVKIYYQPNFLESTIIVWEVKK